MRKFMKGCAITALIFILLGLILGVSGSTGMAPRMFRLWEILSAVTPGRISEKRWMTEQRCDGADPENMGDVHDMIWRTMWIVTQIMKLGRER